MVDSFQESNEISHEIKDFVTNYYLQGIPEGLLAIYTGLEVSEVITILKNKGLFKKATDLS